MTVEWLPYLITGLVALVAATVHSGIGFGYAIIGMSILPLIIPFRSAAAIISLTVCLLSGILFFRLRKHVRLNTLAWPLIGVTIFMPLGLNTMMGSTDPLMRRLLGGLLLLLCLYFFLLGDKVRVRPTRVNGLIAGVVSGFLGGMFIIAGPFLTIYFISTVEDKREYNASLQGVMAIMAPYQLLLHVLWGNMTVQMLRLSAVAAVCVVVGSMLGFMAFQRLKMPALKRIVYCFMMVFGVYLALGG